jgi:hypothetical protein
MFWFIIIGAIWIAGAFGFFKFFLQTDAKNELLFNALLMILPISFFITLVAMLFAIF